MNREKYLKDIQGIRSDIEQRFGGLSPENAASYYDFLKCKANLKNYLPSYKAKSQLDFFKDVWYYRDWAELDQRHSYAYRNPIVVGDQSLLSDGKPKIFCTFHVGSYRLINFLLVKNDLRFTLIVADDHYADMEKEFGFLANNYMKECGADAGFKVLNAQQGNIGLQMIREIKRDNSLIIYIDGNTGVGGMERKDDKMAVIDFLEGQIYARKGVAFLSYATRVPIVPVLSYWSDDQHPVVHLLDPIYPDRSQDREEFCVNTTQRLYNLLGDLVIKEPAQWNGWLYLSNFSVPSSEEVVQAQENSAYTFNQQRFDVFPWENNHCLFDSKTYETFKISENLSKVLPLLTDYYSSSDLEEIMSKDLLHSLIHRKVLIA
jgi:KDO2-lipid IV(A) lauroyltransferase